MILKDDDVFVSLDYKTRTWTKCANEFCDMPSDDCYGGGITADLKRICRHCSRIERERIAGWLKAGCPTQEQSMAKIREIIKRPPRWKAELVGNLPKNFEQLGAQPERVPGEDDQ